MSEHFDAADAASAIDEAEDKELVLIKAVVGGKIGPVQVSVESRDESREAMQELFGAAGATLLGCSRSLASAFNIPTLMIMTEIARAAAAVLAQEDAAALASKLNGIH